MKNNIIRFSIGIILAGIVAEFIHSNFAMHAPSYDAFIDLIAYVTKPLQALGVAIVYYLLGDRLPTRSRFLKGILLGVIVLLVRDGFIRGLVMNLLLPNTWKDVFLLYSQIWLSTFAMTIIIVMFVEPKYGSTKN